MTFQPLLRVVSSTATSSPTVMLTALHSWHAPAKPNKWDGATLQPLLRVTTSAADSSPRSGMAQATPGIHPSRVRSMARLCDTRSSFLELGGPLLLKRKAHSTSAALLLAGA